MSGGASLRTVVAMSGGVDSSVAAGLLAEAGRDLVGVSLQTYDHAPDRGYGRCCSPDDFRDARRVAGRLGIPYYVFDEEEAFRRSVIDRFIADYRQGLTPSPCVLCNSEVKFGTLLDKAERLGARSVATGHYARLARDGADALLLKARDPEKDQSYFLFALDQEQLRRAEFPVGELTKDEVRAQARRLGLAVADKAESQEICFVEGTSYRDFVRERAGDLGPVGEIVTSEGARVGHHDGIGGFTVGQRRGLAIASPDPLFVLAIDPVEARVVVGGAHELLNERCTLSRVNWIPADRTGESIECDVRIRHRHPGARALVRALPGGRAEVEFAAAQRAVCPGQAAVFYDGDRVLGGGWIDRPIPGP
jgi:tRNA-specific 2-thiouridylase